MDIHAKEAAQLFNMSRTGIERWYKKGLLKSTGKDKYGRLYAMADVQYLAEHKTRCRECNVKLNDSNGYCPNGSYSNGYICKECKKRLDRETSAKRRSTNPEAFKKCVTKSKQKAKQAVFSHYCNGDIRCAKCGFDDMRALSIDHINGNGAKQKKELGGSGDKTYRWIKKNDYPPGFQVLCMNCQFIKRYENNEHN